MIARFFDAVDRGDPRSVALLVLLAAVWVLAVWRLCNTIEKRLLGRG